MADMLSHFDVDLLYTSSNAFIFAFPKLFVHVSNSEGIWDASLRFLCKRFSKSIKNNNQSRIIYRDDDIAKLVKT